ncbi:MAG: hypothetical protein NC121_19385 [Blautia sp.]|nr:hypothetical protein [Blautia sp.]
MHMCEKLNAMPQDDEAARESVIRELFAHAGEKEASGDRKACDHRK